MIKCEKTLKGINKITFKGSLPTLQKDLEQIMWTMIQKGEKERAALINAIDNVNSALHQVGDS